MFKSLKESIKNNKKGIFLMLVSSLCACLGQLMWKISNQNGLLYLLIGFSLYFLGALMMIYAYRFGKLSVLQPVLSMNYVLSIVIASVVLKENLSLFKIIGVVIVIIGVVLIAGGD